jgi:anion-transporting  ArsA/GET3 family ATPase
VNEIFARKRIFLVGGPGGVGKTTLAAALGIELARAGYKTVVLTVDPARRLAQALGFEGFQSDLQKVSLPDCPTAELYATMLDTQRYFDRVIERFAASPQQKEKILANPLYRIMVDHLGGTHEYAAMERLLEFARESAYEKIVVDTPPTQNAVDLLSAPQRLAEFMDGSVFKWFQSGGKRYFALLRTGTRLAMKFLKTLFGGEFLDSLGVFFTDLEGMQIGFRERHLEVLELMRGDSTAFFLATYPSEARYLESQSFLKTLAETRIPLNGILLNRVEPETPAPLGETSATGSAALSPADRLAINAVLSYLGTLSGQQRIWLEKFAALAPATRLVRIPRQIGALHDLASLTRIGSILVE